MGKYHVFLSCKDGINIGDQGIDEFLSKFLKKVQKDKDITIESIKRHDDITNAKEDLDDLKESCIYVVDTHKDFDNITYWELGYAMGKGIDVIGYYDGKNLKKIPLDVEKIIPIPHDISRFLDKVNRALSIKTPKELPLFDDWNTQKKTIRSN